MPVGTGVAVEIGTSVAVGDEDAYVRVDGGTGVSVGAKVALGVIVGAFGTEVDVAIVVAEAFAVRADVGASVAVGSSVGIGVAEAVATRLGDGETTVGEGGEIGFSVDVGVLSSRTQPATIPAVTIPETTTTTTRNNPDVTPASSHRTCSQPLPPSPAA